jgi:hypothetical protein
MEISGNNILLPPVFSALSIMAHFDQYCSICRAQFAAAWIQRWPTGETARRLHQIADIEI